MFRSENSRRNALAMSVGWWYLRRLIRKRGTAAVAGYVAGEGLSFARRPRKSHPLRWLVVIGLVGMGGLFWWRKQQGGRDDWGDWDPVAPVAPVAPMPADAEPMDLAPAPAQGSTSMPEADPADLIAT